MKIFKSFIILLLFSSIILSQTDLPKREFRAAWVASVSNLDFPTSSNQTVEVQKARIRSLFDSFKDANMNAVVFQIRPECDALYDSPFEPWSYWLTGTQGAPPAPFYDPLEYAIEEAHKRGMELHAWFNPYRAVVSTNTYSPSPQHVSVQHPDWVLQFGTLKILNPGLPQVRDYNTMVIMDVVNRYDVDGVHFDDYFYPYPPNEIGNEDLTTFQTYPNGFTNIKDWRRNNVNEQMAMINDSIKAVKPWVKFGISPFGIWKNGVPPGIIGMNAYDVIYADPIAWLHEGSIDYLTPQLYWRIGGGQDYSKLMPWWADSTAHYNRHLYTGHIFNSAFSVNELPNQLKLNRANSKVGGSVFFRGTHILINDKGFTDSLKNNYYRYKSILPVMDWKDNVEPNEPLNVKYDRLPDQPIAGLTWSLPSAASDGDTASRYVVYRFEESNFQPEDLENPANIFDVIGERTARLKSGVSPSGKYNFIVTSLDRNYNESLPSNSVEINLPQIPLLAYPNNGVGDQRDTVQLGWFYPEQTAAYNLRLASDESFTNIVLSKTELTDTVDNVTGIGGQQTYYWQIQSTNPAGESEFSEVRSFTTAFPAEPFLVYPPDVTPNIPINIDLVWSGIPFTDSYHVQLAKGVDFAPSSIVVDSMGVTDTLLTAPTLDPNRFYFLRVRAVNSFGYGLWSEIHNFKTQNVTIVADDEAIPENFELAQNYPNPFNPATTITFSIAEQGLTSLKIYDILGREVAELVSEELAPGKYSVKFDAGQYSSGIYIYSLTSNNKIINKKMSFVK